MKALFKTVLLLQAAILVAFLVSGCSGDKGISPELNFDRSDSGVADSPAFRAMSIELYGRVESVDVEGSIIMILGNPTVITVAEGAEIVYKDGSGETPILLADIQVNDSIEVRGEATGSNALLADRVRIRPDDAPEAEMEVAGRVETIDPGLRTLTLVGNSLAITVSEFAEIVQKVSGEELPIGLDEILVGDSVEIRGDMQGDGSLLADRVRLRIGNEFRAEVEFSGIITGIDYALNSFTVDSRSETIMVDTNTIIFFKLDFDASSGSLLKPMSGGDGDDDDGDSRSLQYILFTDLNVGDTVEVYADHIDPNTLLARVIEVEDGAFEHGLQVEFKDFLASVDSNLRTITFANNSGVATVDDNAELQGLNDETLLLSDFAAGELVEIRGFEQSDGTLNVVKMQKEDN